MTVAHYYTRDHEGSVRELVDGSGNIQARYQYDPYGVTTLVSGSNLATFQYARMYMHQTSGLYLTKGGWLQSTGRPYDPNTGRWLSRDPIAESGGLNLYEYSMDDGINNIDPYGTVSDACVKAMIELNAAINDAVKQLQKYNPITDAIGGIPILRGGKPIGRNTVPGGHAISARNAINRVVNALEQVAIHCKNDLPPPTQGPAPSPSSSPTTNPNQVMPMPITPSPSMPPTTIPETQPMPDIGPEFDPIPILSVTSGRAGGLEEREPLKAVHFSGINSKMCT